MNLPEASSQGRGISLGRLLYDETAHAEANSRRRSYRKRGMIVASSMAVIALAMLVISLVLPLPGTYGIWSNAFLVLMPLALAGIAVRGALTVGFRKVYEGGIVDARGHGRPQVWPFQEIEKVDLIDQPDGDTFIGLKLKTDAPSRRSRGSRIPLGFSSDMAGFPEFVRALNGRVPVEKSTGLVM